jgi:cation transport ATPase
MVDERKRLLILLARGGRRMRERERMCVCVCVCGREKERKGETIGYCLDHHHLPSYPDHQEQQQQQQQEQQQQQRQRQQQQKPHSKIATLIKNITLSRDVLLIYLFQYLTNQLIYVWTKQISHLVLVWTGRKKEVTSILRSSSPPVCAASDSFSDAQQKSDGTRKGDKREGEGREGGRERGI